MNHLEKAERLAIGYSGKVSELAEAEAHASIHTAQALSAIASELNDLVAQIKALVAQGSLPLVTEAAKPAKKPVTKAKAKTPAKKPAS